MFKRITKKFGVMLAMCGMLMGVYAAAAYADTDLGWRNTNRGGYSHCAITSNSNDIYCYCHDSTLTVAAVCLHDWFPTTSCDLASAAHIQGTNIAYLLVLTKDGMRCSPTNTNLFTNSGQITGSTSGCSGTNTGSWSSAPYNNTNHWVKRQLNSYALSCTGYTYRADIYGWYGDL